MTIHSADSSNQSRYTIAFSCLSCQEELDLHVTGEPSESPQAWTWHCPVCAETNVSHLVERLVNVTPAARAGEAAS